MCLKFSWTYDIFSHVFGKHKLCLLISLSFYFMWNKISLTNAPCYPELSLCTDWSISNLLIVRGSIPKFFFLMKRPGSDYTAMCKKCWLLTSVRRQHLTSFQNNPICGEHQRLVGHFVVLQVFLAILLGKRKHFSSEAQTTLEWELLYTVYTMSVGRPQSELTKGNDETCSFE